MKNSVKVLLAITAACLCIILGIFIGRNMLPNYYLRTYSSAESDPNATPDAATKGKININTASIDDLTQLPGIGPKIADRIVAYRQENGQFTSIEDLLNIEGIGYATLYNIHELITVGG